MSKHIFEEGPRRGHAAGDTDIEKQASQLASDVRYKVRKAMGPATKMSPAQVSRAYLSQLAKSPAPGAVKSIAKKKLMGEEYTTNVENVVKDSVSKAVSNVFSENFTKKEEVEVEVVEESLDDGKKYMIVVKDKNTGNTYRRKATREKIAELRANPNISSVEITHYGKVEDDEKTSGKRTAAAKAGKDYDGDGKVESGAKEYRGVVHNAIQRKKGLKPDGKDTSGVKEEFIGEVKENDDDNDDDNDRKITGKNVNNSKRIKIFPNIDEQIGQEDPKEAALQRQKLSNLKMLQMKKQQLERQKLQMQKSGKLPLETSSYQPEGEQIDEKITAKTDMGDAIKDFYASKSPQLAGRTKEERRKAAIAAVLTARRGGKKLGEEYCEKCKGECKCGEGDEREIPTKATLFKNKLRAKGIKVAGITPAPRNMKTYDELGESAEDRMRDKRQERGGVAGNVDYSRPPAKKLSNAELGIKPGKTAVQKELEKKHGKGKSAMDIVKSEIRAKHGKKSIM